MQILLPLTGLFLIVLGGLAVLFLLYQVVRQQGRLLLRLDAIEGHLGQLAPGVNPAPTGKPSAAPAGLPLEEIFPSFKLPDLAGKEVALEDFRGKRVLVVNWNPGCGFCARLAPELGNLRQNLAAHNLTLLLTSSGDAEANRKLAREYGLESSILLVKDAPTMEAFRSFGTPVAYLLDEKGRVAMPVAVGADRVPLLARYAVGEAVETELGAQPAQAAAPCATCGQRAGKPKEIESTGPGTELKKLLAAFRIPVTPDCPCNERAALMNANGWAWCEQNLEAIVQWMREEAARRGIMFIGAGARFLVKRAITKARRSDQISERNVAAGMASAQERTS